MCEPTFDAAGGHFAPFGNAHGVLHPEGKHAGDLPNLQVPESGVLSVEIFADGLSLEPGEPAWIFDADGSALVVHAGPDDYLTQPAGGGGPKIACGPIVR